MQGSPPLLSTDSKQVPASMQSQEAVCCPCLMLSPRLAHCVSPRPSLAPRMQDVILSSLTLLQPKDAPPTCISFTPRCLQSGTSCIQIWQPSAAAPWAKNESRAMGWRNQPSQPLPHWDTWGALLQVSLLVRSPLASAASCRHCGSVGTGIGSRQAMPSESQAQPPGPLWVLLLAWGGWQGAACGPEKSQGLELPQSIPRAFTSSSLCMGAWTAALPQWPGQDNPSPTSARQ